MLTILRTGFAAEEGMDVAVSRALLLEASEGVGGETFRLHVPGRSVAFGKQDVVSPGYADAVAAAKALGYSAVERLAGGRAAVFHELTLSFSWTIPDTDPTRGVEARFAATAGLMVGALGRLRIEAQVGEVPGEYCPGRHSVSHLGRLKLVGIGQRLSRRAAHVGGVVVVGRADLVNRPLVPVYRALGIDFDPAVTGSLQDVHRAITVEAAEDAVLAELASRGHTEDGVISPRTIERARSLVADHVPGGGEASQR